MTDKISISMKEGPGPNWTKTNIKLNGKELKNVEKFVVKQSVGKPSEVIITFSEPTIDYKFDHTGTINWRERYK